MSYKAFAAIKAANGEIVVRSAPAWRLEVGDEVVIEDDRHPYQMHGEVLSVITEDEGNDKSQFLAIITDKACEMKVLRRVVYNDFEYSAESEETEAANG